MIFIQTLYIDETKDPFRDFFGWVRPEYHLIGWALSCLQLHKLYGNIILFANNQAARLLIDTLQLPYSEVNLALDKLTLLHPDLWALPKIYTYSLQEQPFLHVDGDVFLFKPFDSGLLEVELIAQNVEVATENFYGITQKDLMRHFDFLPPCVRKDFESSIPFQACNAGIMGGHNLSFFQEYAATAFDYVYKNADSLKHIRVNGFNVFFEQHLFYALSKEKGIPVSVLFKEIINDNGYRNMGDFHEVPFARSYLHLLGHFKRDEYTCIRMAAKLRELYSDYYERIVALFHKKNLRISPCGFRNDSNPPFSQIDEQSNTHLKRLKRASENCPSDIEKKLFQRDFEAFYRQLLSFLVTTETTGYLHERDFATHRRYRDFFADMSGVFSKIIVRCPQTEVIESAFDWAGLFNKHYRTGAGYYSELQITKGKYFNLVVSEDTDNGFSLYDISEPDYAMLMLLSDPLSINEILLQMQDYFDGDVLKNHYAAYVNLMLTSIKQLVLYKAIQPI